MPAVMLAMGALVDLAVTDSSLVVLPPGNSGDLRSPHARDLLERWVMHDYVPLYLSWKRVEATKESALELSPAPRGRSPSPVRRFPLARASRSW